MIINGTTFKNPDWGDIIGITDAPMMLFHARDGTTRRTYIKRPILFSSQISKIRFTLGYAQYDLVKTLFDAIKVQMGTTLTITDWIGQNWYALMLGDSLTLTSIGRYCTAAKEMHRLTFEVEGKIV